MPSVLTNQLEKLAVKLAAVKKFDHPKTHQAVIDLAHLVRDLSRKMDCLGNGGVVSVGFRTPLIIPLRQQAVLSLE
jgi:hypothetical protein